jgi:hypothetical protein
VYKSKGLARLRPLCFRLRVSLPELVYLFYIPRLLQWHLPRREMLIHHIKPDRHALRTHFGMPGKVGEHVALSDRVLAKLRLRFQRVWMAFAAVAGVSVEPTLRDVHGSISEIVL